MIDLSERIEAINRAVLGEFQRLSTTINSKCGVVVIARRNGTWHLDAADGSPVARFNVVPLPNCGAVAVLCDLHIEPPYRGVGLGRMLQQLRIRASEQARIRVLLATVREDNADALRLFTRWRKLVAFTNPETGHALGLWTLELGAADQTLQAAEKGAE